VTTTPTSAASDYPGTWELAAATATLASRLPPELALLARLAFNYHWSWEPGGEEVFRDLDPLGWERAGRNPVRQLADLPLDRAERAAADAELRERIDAVAAAVEAELARPVRPVDGVDGPIAFFCAEFGVHGSLPIYSGGLGVLAGDILKEASDLGYPLVGVGLLYRRGYFHQRVDRTGMQQEFWLQLFPERTPAVQLTQEGGGALELEFELFGRSVAFHVWRVDVGRVPLYLLDTDVPRNDAVERWITSRLYEGNSAIRLGQYGLLGIGGIRALRALGIEPGVLHFNEGHPALAALELASADVAAGVPFEEALARARSRCVFTTHTPVPAGNETYAPSQFLDAYRHLAERLQISETELLDLCRTRAGSDESPGMTPLALRASRRANAVSRRHGEVAREMWMPLYGAGAADETPITHVTNGVHVPTFLTPAFRRLLDRYLGGGWLAREADPSTWAPIDAIPNEELWAARCESRASLVEYVRAKGVQDRLLRGEEPDAVEAAAAALDPDALTLGFARRLATYKRLSLLVHDPARIEAILGDRPVQLVLAGKAHPLDEPGKRMLQTFFANGIAAKVSFLEDYDLSVAQPIVGGCDVWINLPRPPLEASGTSGMKSALNGGLNLSVLDGWWAEAYDGTNGWAIEGGDEVDEAEQDSRHAAELYDLLEGTVVPLFHDRGEDGVPHGWVELMKASLRTNGPRFCATRMVEEYASSIYRPS
jgi:glycogen phosphorylase